MGRRLPDRERIRERLTRLLSSLSESEAQAIVERIDRREAGACAPEDEDGCVFEVDGYCALSSQFIDRAPKLVHEEPDPPVVILDDLLH